MTLTPDLLEKGVFPNRHEVEAKYDHQKLEYGYSQTSGVKENIFVTHMDHLIEPSNKELFACVEERYLQKDIGNVQGRATSWNVPLEDAALYELCKTLRVVVSDLLHHLTEGEQPDMPAAYYPMNAWGVVYNKGDHAKMHNHFPCLWSTVYYINADKDGAPLCFPDFDVAVPCETGMAINFPSYMWHYVPPLNADENRCVFAVNWLYCDSTIRDCMWGHGEYFNQRQIRAHMPPNPWLNKVAQCDPEHISITHTKTLHEGVYANRNKRPNKEI